MHWELRRCFAFFVLILLVVFAVRSSASAQNIDGPTIRIITAPSKGEGPERLELLRARVTDPENACGAGFAKCRVALFSFVSGHWFPQPFLNHQLTAIGPDGLVEEDIHLGSRYAALVVFADRYVDQPEQISILPTRFAIAGDEARAGTQIPEQSPTVTNPKNKSESESATIAPFVPTHSPVASQSGVAASETLSRSVWLALLGVLALSLLLNLTRQVEPFTQACAEFFQELIRVSYFRLSGLRRSLSRKLREEVPCPPSRAFLGIFLIAVVIGAGLANYGIVKFSLEAFLPNPDSLSVLVAIFVCSKAAAGWLCHTTLKNLRASRTAGFACLLVFCLFVLSCVVDAFITYKRVALIEAVNSGTLSTTDVFSQFSEDATLMTAINLLMSCLEFVFAYAAFHLASKPITWLVFSPVLLPALLLERILGVVHKSTATKALTTLIDAVLSAPRVIAVGLIDLTRKLFRALKESTKQTVTLLIIWYRQKELRKAIQVGEAERARLRQADETNEFLHTKNLNDARRAALLRKQEVEIQFEADELTATFKQRQEVNSVLRDQALIVATQNIAKMAEAFPRTFASLVDEAEAQAQTSRALQLERAADAMANASLNPILTMANAQSSLDGHYPPMKRHLQETGKPLSRSQATPPGAELDQKQPAST